MTKIKVSDGLYVGGKDGLEDLGDIDSVINVTTDIPVADVDFFYRIPVLDIGVDSQLDIMLHALPNVCRGIDNMLHDGKTVLVHCNEGKQRSCTVIVAYLMYSKGLSLQDSIKLLKSVHIGAFDDGKVHFAKSLAAFESMLLDPSKTKC